MKRRTFIQTTGLASTLPLIQPKYSWANSNQTGDENILIVVFLGGGADGLNIIAPMGDGNYFDLRPTLALQEPNTGEGSSLDLDGFFAMHPTMTKLHQRFVNGDLAVVHATGLTSDSHSHFTSQDLMQRGIVLEEAVSQNQGWINRHLTALNNQASVFQAVGIGSTLPRSLIGEFPALSMSSVEDFGLNANSIVGPVLENSFKAIYDQASLLDVEAQKALSAMSELREADPGQYQPQNGAVYPQTQFGQNFMEVGQLIRADLGMTTASLVIHGWDHHDNIEAVLPGILTELSDTLDAFATDMGVDMERITVVTMSEFGRRAYENGSAGFDHGHGGFMLAMGGGVLGGQVYGQWPGLAAENLVYTGDLDITTDYRTVLAELLSKRFGQNDFSAVFPDWLPETELGMFV